MPARDIYHDCVRNALLKDGWTITHGPLRLRWGGKDLWGKLLLRNGRVRLIGFDPRAEEIMTWSL